MDAKRRPARGDGNGATAGSRVDYSTLKEGAACFMLFGALPMALLVLGVAL